MHKPCGDGQRLNPAAGRNGSLSAENMQEPPDRPIQPSPRSKARKSPAPLPRSPLPTSSPVDWRKSITKHAMTCLECGHAFKQLSIRHLRQHGLDTRSYRIKYGIPRYPAACRSSDHRPTPAGCPGDTAVGEGATPTGKRQAGE